jgi:hypothetical protein
VMPSHYHWVYRPLPTWVMSIPKTNSHRSPRQFIQHSINRWTSGICNKLLNRRGPFWQRESYDHVVRDDGELERIIEYIHLNPVRAGLVQRPEDYAFSSAGRFQVHGSLG